jgi:outer membrane protein OmpA-like peptidoglycan-associated protein
VADVGATMSKAKLLGAGLIGMLPLAVPAQVVTEGPYIDAGTGANFSRDQRVYNSSGQQVGELEYDGGIPGTLAAGYALANGWRGDVEFGFRRNDVGDGASVASSGSVDVGTMMAMLWFDWPVPWAVRPYAGAGAGQAELDLSGAGTGTSGSDTVFAWQLSTGLLAQLSPKFALTLGYRLLTTEEARFTGSGLRSEYQSDSAMLGLRYYFKPVKRIRMAGADADAAGAAAAAGQAEVAAFEVVLRPVNFKFDRDELTEPAQQTLDEIAARLAKAPDMKVTVDGHTDFIGSSEYNMALGERRANVVRDYLAAKGINAAVVDVRSFGETRPAEDNQSAEGRAVNRRAEITTAEAPPQNVRVRVEPPTAASKEAAQGPEDPLTRREQSGESTPESEAEPAEGQ